MNKKDLIRNVGGLAAALAILGSTSACVPKRVTLNDANFYQGTAAQFSTEYAKRETTLDAAQANREVRCMDKLVGNTYKDLTTAYGDLSQCVVGLREQDMMKYLAFAGLVDGFKAYVVINGLFGTENGGIIANRNDGEGGGVTQTIGNISNSGFGGSMTR